MRQYEKFGQQMLGEPEMQGVDQLGDSAVLIKFLVKTRPLMQWSVKRELLRRIKKRFDQLGIQIPFPQRTIHLSSDEQDNSQSREHANGREKSRA